MQLTIRYCVRVIVATAMAGALSPGTAHGSGHGPVFGAATPTLGKGAWQFDQAWMGQRMDGPADAGDLLRSMIALLGWRFQTRPVGDGARLESTVFVGGLVPLDSARGGVATSPAGYVSVTSGYASRSHYFWAGASHQRHSERSGDRLGSVTSYSLVYGYRPPAWRLEYPKPDLRFFIEAVGDKTDRTLLNGRSLTDTGGHVVLVGPTMLLLYKAYGVEGGVLFPVYQRTNGLQAGERFRFGVNFTYFFWPGKGKGH
jgi:hypothetical protein